MEDLSDFPVRITIPIAWSEMDAYGHINNVYYLRYFETARIQYLQEIGLMDMKVETDVGPILAQTTCKYLKPLQYPDQIIVGAKTTSMSKSSFVMEYLIVSEKIGVAASGEGVIVMYDYNASKKAEIPPIIRKRIAELEKKDF
ncbi:putative esterase [Desulfosporosinus acididurans]|uniref:Putative esterase n=1 Tax=Desulfosporosinus acididurans TaxID=476652 RepID=A0A0J1FPL2_9FIRM|nr:thioesterase family protein [Desulfosporosinus acididurans]KLU65430.1 putative esterase [Desulfosporosinus acididurans]